MNKKITDYFPSKGGEIKENKVFSSYLFPHQNHSSWIHQSKALKLFATEKLSIEEFFEHFENLVYGGRREKFTGLPGFKSYFFNLNREQREKFMIKVLPFMASKSLEVN
jgi:hypothetical protein